MQDFDLKTMAKGKYKDFLNTFLSSQPALIDLALTHSSYANDHNLTSNERIEFLGDSVLGCIVAEYLYDHTKKAEGSLSKMRSALVCEQALSGFARAMHLEQALRLGRSCKNKPVSDAMLCDTVEAMIGAMFLSFGFEKIKAPILKMLGIDEFLKTGNDKGDYKTILQEYCQANKIKIEYQHTSEINKGGQETFTVTVIVDGKRLAHGKGSKVKIAEKNCARLAYEKLTKNALK